MTKNCPNCGKEIEETDQFCKNCAKSTDTKVKITEKPKIILIAIVVIGFRLLQILDSNFGEGWPEPMPVTPLFTVILYFAVIIGLWNLKKWAGILLVIHSSYFLILNKAAILVLFSFIGFYYIVLPLIFIILIALGWNKLED